MVCIGEVTNPCDILVGIYIDDSKIIHTIGTCFAVSYTAGWA
jgi:hypothetical protein